MTAFVEALSKRRVTSSTRQTRGLEANAACGQLRNEFQKTPIAQESVDALLAAATASNEEEEQEEEVV